MGKLENFVIFWWENFLHYNENAVKKNISAISLSKWLLILITLDSLEENTLVHCFLAFMYQNEWNWALRLRGDTYRLSQGYTFLLHEFALCSYTSFISLPEKLVSWHLHFCLQSVWVYQVYAGIPRLRFIIFPRNFIKWSICAIWIPVDRFFSFFLARCWFIVHSEISADPICSSFSKVISSEENLENQRQMPAWKGLI